MHELAVVVRTEGGDHDVVVRFDDRTSIGQLADQFATQLTTGAEGRSTLERITRKRAVFARDARLAHVSIHSGDVVRVAPDSGLYDSDRGGVVCRLTVRPTGRPSYAVEIHRGETIIGRDDSCDLTLDDTMASRRHAKLIATDVVEVVDLGSTNTTQVNDVAVVSRRRLRNGDELRIGNTVLVVEHTGHSALPNETTGNLVEFNRTPRARPGFHGRKHTAPAPPDPVPKQRLPMITAAAPLLMGVVMYLMTKQLYSVVFIGMSPLMMLGSWYENKRSGRADLQERLLVHQQDVAALIAALDAERDREVEYRFDAAPGVGRLSDLARQLDIRLWERQPGDEDFLELRVGLAPLPSSIEVEVPDGGARELRGEIESLPGRYAMLPPVPVTVGLLEVGSIGVAGASPYAEHLARGLVAQAATLHSPSELVICALVAEPSVPQWEWLKWLPHSRSPLSPLTGVHLAGTVDDALALLAELGNLIDERQPDGYGEDAAVGPHVLVVVDDALPLERARLTRLLRAGPEAGIHALWISSSFRRLPKPCGAAIDIDPAGGYADVTYVHRGTRVAGCQVELMDAEAARTLARDLAPIIDVSSRQSQGAGIPPSASLVELLGGAGILDDPGETLARWEESQAGRGLRAAVGAGSSSVFSVDLRHDGPHGLVAGTTGAGKSEFLQSLLVSLATTHSPARVNFLLVDYKGGSAFKDCVQLPHTVGLVTDLTPALVRRALTSLRAEVHRRERLLNTAGAKDLLEMEQDGHPETPPSLVIVVDEFAALAREVPEFVDGVVDIAQRGRSLGLHLLLATQRPAGVVTDNIRANTNLKVALRVASDEESQDVIGSPAAAQIDRSRPGRAVARLGPSELIAFQSGYVGGTTTFEDDQPMLEIADLGFGHSTRWPVTTAASASRDGAETDLERLVRTINAAFQRSGLPEVRRPWLDPLARVYDLERLPRTGDDGKVPIGVVDEPDRQWQRLAMFEPDTDGSLLIYGAGGAGKTAALRTLATSSALCSPTLPLHVYGVDAAGRGLEMLEPLPQVGSIVSADDYERFTRLLRDLTETIDERARRFADHGASTLGEFRATGGSPSFARVLVLVDGFENLASTYEKIDRGQWLELLMRLVADGRSVGVHFALTGTRRSSFPPTVTSTVGRRLVLRLATQDELLSLGVDPGLIDGDEPPGRCVDGDHVVQVALVGGRTETAAQAQAIRRIGELLRQAGAQDAPEVQVLPDVVPFSDLAASNNGRLVVGLDERLAPFHLPADLGRMLVAGPPRSGRSTAIATLAAAAQRAGSTPVVLSGKRPVPGIPATSQVVGEEAVERCVRALLEQPSIPLLLIDELEELLDGAADYPLQQLLQRDDVAVVASCEVTTARRALSQTVGIIKRSRRAFLLQPDPDLDGDLANTTIPRTRRVFPPGRGLFADSGLLVVAQWADAIAR